MTSRPATEGVGEIFDRILCGVDGTPQGAEAVRQGARLRSPEGSLTVVSVFDDGLVAQAGWAATQAAEELRRDAERALEAAEREVADASFRLVTGRPFAALAHEAKRLGSTLVSVGSHSYRRGVGIVLGSVATTMLHEAPCSVLIARAPEAADEFPRSLVVGIDGSPESAAAAAVAFGLGERFGAGVQPVSSASGKDVDPDAAARIAPGVVLEQRRPVDALVTAARDSDLLVVGSRGLHGIRALGSVSERVAHRAKCSVLVVRPPARAS